MGWTNRQQREWADTAVPPMFGGRTGGQRPDPGLPERNGTMSRVLRTDGVTPFQKQLDFDVSVANIPVARVGCWLEVRRELVVTTHLLADIRENIAPERVKTLFPISGQYGLPSSRGLHDANG